MAFLDSLSKKVTQVSQTTIQKTKDFAEITKINSLIDDEKKRIEDTYMIIGKLYCERHENDAESEFAEKIAKIKEAEKKIASYNSQKAEIKGVVYCKKCGAEILAGSAFCSSCGSPVEKAFTEQDEENTVETEIVEVPEQAEGQETDTPDAAAVSETTDIAGETEV